MSRCAACGHVTSEPFKFCPECGAPAAEEPHEERKTVTVLFCDVVGSTELGLKGRSGRVRGWELREVKAAETRRVSAVPRVGRERVLDILRGAFPNAAESHACRFVTIVGAAGVGKSRLVAEFLGGLDGAR